MLYGTSKIIVDHQKLGDDFRNISKVISISIMYFNLGLGDDYIYYGTNNFYGLNTHNKLIVKKQVELNESIEPKHKFVEKNIFPEYYLITVERYKNIVQKKIDEWIYMFKNNEIAEGSTSKNIDKAAQKLAEINMSEPERKTYDKYLINIARDRDAINTAKAEGHEEGLSRGKYEKENISIRNAIIKGKLTYEEIAEMIEVSLDKVLEIVAQISTEQHDTNREDL